MQPATPCSWIFWMFLILHCHKYLYAYDCLYFGQFFSSKSKSGIVGNRIFSRLLKYIIKFLYEKFYCTSLHLYPGILLLIINISSVDDLCGYFVTSIFTKELLCRINHKLYPSFCQVPRRGYFIFF